MNNRFRAAAHQAKKRISDGSFLPGSLSSANDEYFGILRSIQKVNAHVSPGAWGNVVARFSKAKGSHAGLFATQPMAYDWNLKFHNTVHNPAEQIPSWVKWLVVAAILGIVLPPTIGAVMPVIGFVSLKWKERKKGALPISKVLLP